MEGFFMTEKYGFVYIWRDKKHNRYYIGCHWGTIDDGYICSSPWMKQAYKYRPHDFRRRILSTNLLREEMYVEEQRFFDMIRPEEIKVRYYNLNLKTNKLWHADPDKALTVGEKISKAKKGKKVIPCTPERARKISEGKKGKKPNWSEEGIARIRDAASNRIVSDEQKQKISEGVKKHFKDNGHNCTGTTLSEEHKEAISRKLKGRKKDNFVMTDARKEAIAKRAQAGAEARTGSKAYNNGEIEVRSKTHPGEGWELGGLSRKVKSHK